MKKVLIIIALISFIDVVGQSQVGDNFVIQGYSPSVILKRNVDTGGYIQGIRSQLMDGTNNFWFGNRNTNEWYIAKGNFDGPRWISIKNGKVGIGTSLPDRMLDVYVPHQINTNEAIRIGSLNSTNYNGIGLNYRIDANSVPTNYLVSFIDNKTHDILTYTPDYLALSTNLTEKMRILSNGNVGIGTTTPGYKLHIKGDTYLDGTESINGWMITNLFWKGHSLVMGTPKGKYAHNRIELKPGGSSSGQLRSQIQLYQALDETNQQLRVDIKSDGITFFNGGNVGIGTSDTFGYKLAVNGIIGAKEINVEITNPWPDYVFTKDYQLPSLENLENQIKECGHLPNIPSAKEVLQEGIALGEMNVKLLEKIEELTLYTIQQEKKIKEQEARLAKLEELLLKK